MTCPYCAAFGRDLFGQSPRALRAATPRREALPAAWRGEEEPSWPIGFGTRAQHGALPVLRSGGGAAPAR